MQLLVNFVAQFQNFAHDSFGLCSTNYFARKRYNKCKQLNSATEAYHDNAVLNSSKPSVIFVLCLKPDPLNLGYIRCYEDRKATLCFASF